MLSAEPKVELVGYSFAALDDAIAAARSCYSSQIVSPLKTSEDPELRDKIAESTFDARHHTIYQHATFTFALSNISRQLIWGLLHSHPFYNSEQVSQRYVKVKKGNHFIPDLDERQLEVYEDLMEFQMDSYHRLIEELIPLVEVEYCKRFPKNKKGSKSDIKKKAQEAARYVLPVATFAHMYHTISLLTLFRLNRLSEQFDVPEESRAVAGKMVQCVEGISPDWRSLIEEPIALENTLEYRIFSTLQKGIGESAAGFAEEFDRGMDGRVSKLEGYTAGGEESIASAVREVLGISKGELDDDHALELIFNPEMNHYLGERLTLDHTSKIGRAGFHSSYTFKHRISHSADSQAQRQRMSFGSRPILLAHMRGEPDYITPALIRSSERVEEIYRDIHKRIWEGIDRLKDMGAGLLNVQYVLPNSVPIRYRDTTDLLNLKQRFEKRICLNAQEEIWRSTVEQKEQIAEVHPRIAKYLLAPCNLRKMAGERPYCPEGGRYCGIPVWKGLPEKYKESRLI